MSDLDRQFWKPDDATQQSEKKIKAIRREKKRARKGKKKKRPFKKSFYTSPEWREVRYKALLLHGRKCQCCGAMPPSVTLHVDHVKPRSKYPGLELDIHNLQVLCEDCNLGKSNKDETDFR